MTPEEIAVKNAIMVDLIDVARERGFTRAIVEDMASRGAKSGKMFINHATGGLDTVAGYSGREFVEMLADDPSAKHYFSKPDKPDAATIYGIPADKFEKLSAMQRLELANKHAAKTR